jgi:hypothetical protein
MLSISSRTGVNTGTGMGVAMTRLMSGAADDAMLIGPIGIAVPTTAATDARQVRGRRRRARMFVHLMPRG